MYKQALVFGKFYPYHLGHHKLIQHALTIADSVTVIVCAENSETIDVYDRIRMISDSLEINYDRQQYNIIPFSYNESDLLNGETDYDTISSIWAKEFSEILKQEKSIVDVLVTSETYGDKVASDMGIDNVVYNMPRTITPISATVIRSDFKSNWKYLPYGTRLYYIKNMDVPSIILIGSESTGKTEMVKLLSKHYNVKFVSEYGRQLLDVPGTFISKRLLRSIKFRHTFEMFHMKQDQLYDLLHSVDYKEPFIICDTDGITTDSYYELLFNDESDYDYHTPKSKDLYLFMNTDVPYVDDGTRGGIDIRNELNRIVFKLASNKVQNMKVVTGSDYSDRMAQCINHIDYFLNTTK